MAALTKNIMIVGVGGQGSLLASKLLGHLLLSQGLDVKVSEVHGMSQRGGSVVTYVRWGEKVFETHSQEIGWDGTFKGKECQRGVYDWYFKGTCKDGDELEQKGNVTLIRSPTRHTPSYPITKNNDML